MENKTKHKEFDCQRWENGLEIDQDYETSSTMDRDDKGNFVRHEDHLTTIQLSVDDAMKSYRIVLLPVLGEGLLSKLETEIRQNIQSKFTDRIWEGE